jgi:hypothetical protein
MIFTEFDLYSDALCMGERTKGGLFRPCARTIRYSQISGALRKKFGRDEIHAAGYLVEGNGWNSIEYLVYSPRDKVRAVSKIPLQVEFLTNVHGKVYILEDDFTANLPQEFEIHMGALISKGFGRCRLRKRRQGIEDKPITLGTLKTRIPLNRLNIFGIAEKDIRKPVYGYLFEPTSPTSGVYVLSLFEGSEVVAPEFLILPTGKGR